MLRLPPSLTSSIPWNLWLILMGSAVFAFGLKAVALPYDLLSGGFSGLGLLVHYAFPALGPGVLYLLINIPVFILGWLMVSRRFVLYSLFGAACLSLFIELLSFTLQVENRFLAAMAGGVLMGAGNGIILHSLGSAGGLNIIGVILNQRWNFRMGQVSFAFNFLLFSAGLVVLDVNDVLYSLAMMFLAASVMEYFLGMFNERKIAIIISERAEEIGEAVKTVIRRGVTYLHGRGGYSGRETEVVLTVVNNVELKRLEELVYSIDPKAFTIFDNVLNVLGEGFSHRKRY